MRNSTIIVLAALLCGACTGAKKACCTNANPAKETSVSPEDAQTDSKAAIEEILSKMNTATKKLRSCRAKLSYLSIQDPELLNSSTLQNGLLFYQKTESGSKLRIRFDDMKQDDFDPVKQREEYLFDGIWLTRINYKLQQVDIYQQAPEDKPIGVFELISHNFPLIGFSNINDIKNDFDISLAPKTTDPNELVCLLLKVKKDSDFIKDYEKISMWLDNDLYLPAKMVAYTRQGDEYRIEFKDMEINKKLENAVFAVATPAHFRKNIEPLKKEP
ncbi:MAG: LolA family protein [Planctomycetota bacterium]|jgi:outer membrane lipoprotein-sorting protein